MVAWIRFLDTDFTSPSPCTCVLPSSLLISRLFSSHIHVKMVKRECRSIEDEDDTDSFIPITSVKKEVVQDK
jgi:hypothetical protein